MRFLSDTQLTKSKSLMESSTYWLISKLYYHHGIILIEPISAGLSTIGNSNEFGEKKLATLIEGRDLVDPETFQGWEDMLRLNLIAPFFVIKAFIPLLTQGAKSRMEGTSAVINITSVSATSRTVVDFSSVSPYHDTYADQFSELLPSSPTAPPRLA